MSVLPCLRLISPSLFRWRPCNPGCCIVSLALWFSARDDHVPASVPPRIPWPATSGWATGQTIACVRPCAWRERRLADVQEAVIGVVFVVAASAEIILLG